MIDLGMSISLGRIAEGVPPGRDSASGRIQQPALEREFVRFNTGALTAPRLRSLLYFEC